MSARSYTPSEALDRFTARWREQAAAWQRMERLEEDASRETIKRLEEEPAVRRAVARLVNRGTVNHEFVPAHGRVLKK